jgi:hypothetical protein
VTVASNNGPARGSQAPVFLNGRELDYGLRHQSARTRAKVALGLINGELNVGRLNRMQAARICRISYAQLAKKPAQPLDIMGVAAWWNQVGPDARVALIRELGVLQVWDAISAIIG